MELASGARLGPYEVVEPLGAGGMGEVYRAHDPRLRRDVALKVILEAGESPSRDRLKRFEEEARAVAALSHPNVLSVFDVGSDDGRPYVVFELLEGQSLREALADGPLPLRRAMDLGLQICRGLEAAHARDLIHRDLKPENLFLTTGGVVKILDFGLAKLVRGEEEGPLPVGTGAEGTAARTDTAPGTVLGTLGYLSPEQVRGQEADARADLFSLGAVLYEMVSGARAFSGATPADTLSAILHAEPPALGSPSGAVPPGLEKIVRRCLEKDPRDRFHSAHDVALALEAVRESPAPSVAVTEGPEARSPYPGLRYFTEKDAGRFFGREGEVEALWERLKTRPLLAVIGPSGAGKSSFIRAGVVASRPSGWGALVCTPGSQALRGLGEALAPELAGDADALKKLLEFEETAFELVTRWRGRYGEALLVVDQLEELYTLNSPEVQERFPELLGRLAAEGDVHVVLSLRDDFLMRCGEHEALQRVFTELTPLYPLSPEGLRRAVEEPAKREGFSFEDGLVEEMLQAVEGARGALPLLAFAVSRLWEKRDREKKILTRAAYEQIGGVAGALAQHAEQTLDRIGAERQPLVRELFRNLVTAQGTRASSEREELLSVLPDAEVGSRVLDELIGARLLTSYEVQEPAPSSRGASSDPGDEGSAVPSGTTHRIEVVHESLLKAWPRLVWWQAQDEEGAQLRDQLRQAAHLWEEKGRSGDVLWTGRAFREFELWRERYPGTLTALEEEFARAMVERDRRRRNLRRGAIAAGFVLLAAVATAIGVSRQEALEQARRAEAAQLLALAETQIEEDPTEALSFATASLELADTEEARMFAVRALADSPPALELTTDRHDFTSVPVFSPDGRWLAAAGFVEEAAVWREDGQGPLWLEGLATSTSCPNYPLWPSPSLLATGLGCGSRIQIWSLPGGERLGQIDYDNRRFDGVLAAFWSVGVDRVSVHTRDSTGRRVDLRSWALPDAEGRSLGEIGPEELEATPLRGRFWGDFEPGGGGWLYARGREVMRLPLPAGSGPPVAVDRHPDDVVELYAPFRASQGWVSIDRSGEIHVHSGPPASAPIVLHRPAEAPEGSYPGPSGRWIAAGSEDPPELRVWDTVSPSQARPLRLRRRGADMTSWDIHPSGDWIVVPQGDAALTFWPLRHPRPVVIDNDGRGLTFSKDGRLLAFLSGGAVRVWSIEGTRVSEVHRVPLPQNAGVVGGLTLSTDNRFVLASGDRAFLIPLDGGSSRRLEGFADEMALATALSPSGRRVAGVTPVGPGPKQIRVWDLQGGETLVFDSPTAPAASSGAGSTSEDVRIWEGGVWGPTLVGENTLYTAGEEGIWRWDLVRGTHEQVSTAAPAMATPEWLSHDGRTALVYPSMMRPWPPCGTLELLRPGTGAREPLPQFGCGRGAYALDPSGTVAVHADADGVVRVGRVSAAEPHLILGHDGVIAVALSPDLRWVATVGNGIIRLWPMPDLDLPPLHALPHEALLAKLKSLTNLRAVRDPEDPSDWTIEVGPFPGWKEVPTW